VRTFAEQIDHTALALEAAGITQGNHVGVLSDNSPAFAVLIGACLRIGAVVVPVSTRYPAARIHDVITDTRCNILLASQSFSNVSLPQRIEPLETFTGAFKGDVSNVTLGQIDADLNNEATIIMTSGTAGQPRGVLHRLSRHYHSALGSDTNIAFERGHYWLMSLPMYHVSGLSVLIRAFIHGAGLIFPKTNQPLQDAILKTEATHLSLVPVQLSHLLDDRACIERLKAMEAILVGGSATPQALIDRALQLELPIRTTYGSTEAASQVATTGKGQLGDRPGTSGRILQHRQLRIADDGEILIRGQTILDGYIEHGDIRPGVDEDGWFRSRDVGTIDHEGFLYVRGRKDSMFISGGENIYPEEIECLLANAEGIERAIVVGVEQGDMGSRPVAFVRVQDGHKLDPDALRQWTAEHLESFKIPVAFLQWPGQLGALGKSDRQKLTSQAAKLIGDADRKM